MKKSQNVEIKYAFTPILFSRFNSVQSITFFLKFYDVHFQIYNIYSKQ